MSAEAIRQGDIPGVQLRVRRRLDLPAGELWPWLSEPERLARWLGRVEEGGPESMVLASAGDGGAPLRERLVTRERRPPHSWTLTLERLDAGWKAATVVAVELRPAAGGCELAVLQRGFEQLSLSTCLTEWERYRRRWRRALERLERAADPG